MSDPLEFSSYQFQESPEFCLKIGAKHARQVLLVPPLFDEMNRMRRALVDVMRALNDLGIGSLLPDLPGCNESLFPAEQASLAVWRKAIGECARHNGNINHIASFRGGCLIDEIEQDINHWRLTPAKGKSLLRTLIRTQIGSDKESGVVTTMDDIAERARSSTVSLAGNVVGSTLFEELQNTVPNKPEKLRTARLESDSQRCDINLPGTALWLRAEPDSDATLSQAIAKDLAEWIQ